MSPLDNSVCPENKQEVSRRIFLKAVVAGASGFAIVSCTAQQGDRDEAQGTLRVAWAGALKQLDPLFVQSDVDIAFINAVYDYLIDTDARSGLVPRLAADWAVSEDGRIYTLTIVENAMFHDGSQLSIEDIIWTFDRLRDPSIEDSPTANLFADIESIEPGEENTVVFRLSQPNPDFLHNLSDSHAVILKADARNIGTDFNGTGPFRLEESITADRARFSRNDDYWGGAPAFEALEFVYFADVQAAANALRDGAVDAVIRLDNATFRDLSEEENFNSIEITTNGHDLVRLRADQEPGNDERVRRAFKMATDRESIFQRVQLGYGAMGRDNPVGPLYSAYYTEEFPLLAYDPEGAKALLGEAGYPTGLAMTLHVPDLQDRVALAQALKAQWEVAGIAVTLDIIEENTYYAQNIWLEAPLAITPWASRPTPQQYLEVAYRTDAEWNEAHFSDDELDGLIDLAGSSLDDAERANAYREIQRILIERGPVIIPYFFAQFGVMAEHIEGIHVHPFAGRTNFHRATL
jgi:peptide/nickel transport system substrate-binding protein